MIARRKRGEWLSRGWFDGRDECESYLYEMRWLLWDGDDCRGLWEGGCGAVEGVAAGGVAAEDGVGVYPVPLWRRGSHRLDFVQL